MAKKKPVDQIHEALCDIIVEQCGCERNEITANAHFVDDLGFDDLDVIEMVMELEEHFELGIPDSIASEWKTVGDVEAWLKKQQVRV